MYTLKKLIALLALLLPCYLCAQITCNPVFQKIYGGEVDKDDEAIDITYCNDGGMIICGQTTSYSAGQYDGLLMKLSENGTPEWTRIYGSVGNDKLIKVKQTADGGFIAIGETTSFVNTRGETWVLKTDAVGAIQWNKRYSLSSTGREKPRDIIQLRNGGYCIAINSNDSTSDNDAVIVRMNNLGNILWSKSLDAGDDDGVNNIAEYNDTLLIAGYATVNDRDAIITKLLKENGSFISAQKYSNSDGYNDEALGVEIVNNSIAFSAIMYPINSPGDFYPLSLTYFRMDSDGSITYQRKAQANTATAYRVENIQTRSTRDNGFIYLMNDTTLLGYSKCIKSSPYGELEWGRSFYDYGKARTTGMDTTTLGYVFAGYKNDYFTTSNQNKIQVFRTDGRGKEGVSCSLQMSLDFIDTSQYTITSFTWKTFQSITVNPIDNGMITGTPNFSVSNSCEQLLCDTVQTLQSQCSTNFMAEYSSELNLNSLDVVKLTDGGYAMAGSYSYYSNLEPALIKANPNGSIAWAKTYNVMAHDARFLKVLPLADNTMLLMGEDSYTINHGVSDSAILTKVSNSGTVIWAKKYARMGAQFSDIKATDDGGFVVTMNENYGSGSDQFTEVNRLDANGNFVWKKQIDAMNIVARSLLFDKSSIYVLINDYINYAGGAAIIILKLDAASGNMIWEKDIRSTQQQSLNPVNIEKIGDTVIAAVHIYTTISMFETKREAGFIKMNPADGSSYGAYKITNINHVSPESITYYGQSNAAWAISSGNDMIFANPAVLNSDTSIYISRVSSDGKLIWSKQYQNLKTYNVTSIKHVDDGFALTGIRVGKQLNANDVNDIFPYLLKIDETGNIANAPSSPTCTNTDYAALIDTFSVTDVPYIRQVNVVPLPESAFWGYLAAGDYTAYVRDVKNLSKVYCSKVSNCNFVKITGQDSICSLQGNFKYLLEKNAGCDAAAVWHTDTTFANIIQATDSTISLQFKKTGNLLLNTSITSGCTGLSAQKQITVIQSANTLNLGLDTILCANNTYTLKASPNFKTYTWFPDVSKDSTEIINTPGSYQLKVSDYCGNTFSDTVNIKPAKFLFSAGADTSKCNSDSIVLTATTGFQNYKWQPEYHITNLTSSTTSVFPDADTSYTVQAEKYPGCFVRDTVHVSVLHSPSIFLGNDTSLCIGQSVELNIASSFTKYFWSTGQTTQTITVSKKGVYSVKATASNGCSSYDTIAILNVLPLPSFTLGKDTTLCAGNQLAYNFNLQNASYLWSDGSSSNNESITQQGTYWLSVKQQGCTSSDTIEVRLQPSPVINLGNDTALCEGTMKLLDATNENALYQWQDNSTLSQYEVRQAGLYYVKATINGCSASDSINIQYTPTPVFDLGKDIFLCKGSSLLLNPSLNTTVNYLWQDGSTYPSYEVKALGIYTLTATNNCGSWKDSVSVTAQLCKLNMPSAFTPNKDGNNDIFKVQYPFPVKQFNMVVCNRWGQRVFESKDITKGWDGTINNVDQDMGTYIWIISLVDIDNIKQTAQGTVTLIR